MADSLIGNTGESLDDVVAEINEFTSANPGEVIFLRFKYLVAFGRGYGDGGRLWNNDVSSGVLGGFVSSLGKLNLRCPNLDASTTFEKQPIGNFLDGNGGKGCVIVLLDGHLDKNTESAGDGIYAMKRMNIWDDWSNKEEPEAMAATEIQGWQSIPRSSDGGDSDKFFIAQWLLTLPWQAFASLDLQTVAVLPTNPTLYFTGVNAISPEKFPNVLMVDYIGVVTMNDLGWDDLSAELYALAIGLNLFTLSDNCFVDRGRPPLLPAASKSAAVTKGEQKPMVLFEPWTGVIFANGTRLEQTPEWFSWDGPLGDGEGGHIP